MYVASGIVLSRHSRWEELENELGVELRMFPYDVVAEPGNAVLGLGSHGRLNTIARDIRIGSGGFVIDGVHVPDSLTLDFVTTADGVNIGHIEEGFVHCWIEAAWFRYEYAEVSDLLHDALFDALRKCVGHGVDPAQAEARQREQLVEFARSTYDRQIREKRAVIDIIANTISGASREVASNMRRIREENELLDALLLVRQNDAGERLLRQWDQLVEHPRVDACTLSHPSTIVITTTDDLRLYRSDTGDSRWLGAFRITIDLVNMGITLNNLNTRRGGRDHPHVTGDGHPCFGGHQDDFTELMGRGELLVLFELLIQYIENLNLTDEYGRYGSFWFDVEDERPLEVAEEALVTA